MELEFILPPVLESKYTANVHSTGRLGFTLLAAEKLGIEVGKSMRLAVEKGYSSPTTIYGEIIDGVDENSAYKIMKAGKYHSVNAKGFFDKVAIKYSNRISYQITEVDINGKKYLKFTQK